MGLALTEERAQGCRQRLDEPMCLSWREAGGERAHDSGIEAEANFLGGCLLMPNEAAIHVVTNGLSARAQLIYGVSRPMLDYRLRVSGAHVIHKRQLAHG